MPRKPRPYLPDVPVHVVQRGHNRDACFFADDDYLCYLDALEVGCRRYGVAVHAYCLMNNHVHLLMTPESIDSIPRVMQHIGRIYVAYINKTYQRSGTLWEGRYKCSLVDAEQYLLSCYRNIELNPVVADMVKLPNDYRWSSYRSNGLGESSSVIKPHDVYIQLSQNKEQRLVNYRTLFNAHVDDAERLAITKAANANVPLGNDRFREQIEVALGRKLGSGLRGRPTKRN